MSLKKMHTKSRSPAILSTGQETAVVHTQSKAYLTDNELDAIKELSVTAKKPKTKKLIAAGTKIKKLQTQLTPKRVPIRPSKSNFIGHFT